MTDRNVKSKASIYNANSMSKSIAKPSISNNMKNSIFGSVASKSGVSRYAKSSMMTSGIGSRGARGDLGEAGRLNPNSGNKPMEVIRIFDEEGNDVTPIPLSFSSVSAANGTTATAPVQLGNGKTIGGTNTVNMNAADLSILMRSTNDVLGNAFNKMESQTLGSFAGGGSIFRSTASEEPSQQSQQQSRMASLSQMSIAEDSSTARNSTAGGTAAALTNAEGKRDDLDAILDHPYPGFVPPKELAPLNPNKPLTEKDLLGSVSVVIAETDYITLFDMPSLSVSSEFTDDYDRVNKENQDYQAKIAFYAGSQNQTSHACQTQYLPQKHKDVQASQTKTASTTTIVTSWMIADAEQELRAQQQLLQDQNNGDIDGAEDTLTANGLAGIDEGGSGLVAASIDGTSALLFSETALNESAAALESGTENGSRSIMAGDYSDMSMMMSSSGASMTSTDASMSKRPDANLSIDGAAATTAVGSAIRNENMKPEKFFARHTVSLESSLNVMERAILGNNNADRLLTFRNAIDDTASQNDLATKTEEASSSKAEASVHADSAAAELAAVQFDISSVSLLWSFRCELTRGRTVTNMCWNPKSKDVIAIAYGASSISAASAPGLVLCWSVQNPEWPERIYIANSPVTCLNFSLLNPCLLAIGMKDGNMLVYDIRRKENRPSIDISGFSSTKSADGSGALSRAALDSAATATGGSDLSERQANGKHRDAVWDILWINLSANGSGRSGDENGANGNGLQLHSEAIVSVSTDGRVLQHQIKMAVEHSELTFLKPYVGKITRKGNSGSGASDEKDTSKNALLKQGAGSVLSRSMGGLCIDFSPTDNSLYLVGTEEGHVHLCSTTYNEQYLSSFIGHTGPVYKIKWNKFRPGIFISCSSDWTVRIWDQRSEEALLNLQNGKDVISDVCWSQQIATMFATTSIDGTLEIWDLSNSILDPFVSYTALDRSLTAVSFAPEDTSIILTGDDNGTVDVYKIRKMPKTIQNKSAAEQGEILHHCLQSNSRSR